MSKTGKEVRPFVRVYTKYRRISINLAVHDILGKPPCFEFFWSEENKLLFIAPFWEIKIGCYQISARIYQSRKQEIIVEEKAFFNGLMKKLRWQNDKTYKVFGEFIPKYNMIGFRMANPIIIEESKR